MVDLPCLAHQFCYYDFACQCTWHFTLALAKTVGAILLFQTMTFEFKEWLKTIPATLKSNTCFYSIYVEENKVFKIQDFNNARLFHK